MSKNKNKFKCSYCDKTFKLELNRDKHENKFCKSNPIKIDEETIKEEKIEEILEENKPGSVEIWVDEDEPKYTDNELFLLETFKKFNPANILLKPELTEKLHTIYIKDYNRKMNGSCASQQVRMYMFLYNQVQKIIK